MPFNILIENSNGISDIVLDDGDRIHLVRLNGDDQPKTVFRGALSDKAENTTLKDPQHSRVTLRFEEQTIKVVFTGDGFSEKKGGT